MGSEFPEKEQGGGCEDVSCGIDTDSTIQI